jgi:hypothetical protein
LLRYAQDRLLAPQNDSSPELFRSLFRPAPRHHHPDHLIFELLRRRTSGIRQRVQERLPSWLMRWVDGASNQANPSSHRLADMPQPCLLDVLA